MIASLLPKEIAQSINLNQEMHISIETARFSEAYDNWGKYLGAQPPTKLIEAQVPGIGRDQASSRHPCSSGHLRYGAI